MICTPMSSILFAVQHIFQIDSAYQVPQLPRIQHHGLDSTREMHYGGVLTN
jgi:hypothetical protein